MGWRLSTSGSPAAFLPNMPQPVCTLELKMGLMPSSRTGGQEKRGKQRDSLFSH